MTVTVDNASANDVAVNYLKKKLKNWKGDAMILDGDYLHLWCCAHIFNIIVTEGLKEMHDSITSIRNAIMYVRSSGLRLHKFKSCVEREKIEYKGILPTLCCPELYTFKKLLKVWKKRNIMDHI